MKTKHLGLLSFVRFLLAILISLGCTKLDGQDIQIADIPVPFPSTTISGMAQDNYGNIWIATNNQGLYKYNGDEFQIYNHQRDNPNTVISDRLECIFSDKNGILWIGSFASGLSRLDPSNDLFTNFTHDSEDAESIRSNGVRRIAQDNVGRIWVATEKGLDYLDPESNTFRRDFEGSEDAEILSKEHIRALYLDKSGILWAGSSSPFFGEQSMGGLYRIDPNSKIVERYTSSEDSESLNNNVVTAIYEDSRGVFWVGTAGDGLHTMDRELGTFQRHVNVPGDPNQLSRPPVKGFAYALDHIRFIEEDASGKIWIGTMNNGINVYDPSNGNIVHLNSERKDKYALPINDFWTVLRTKDDLLWFGAWSPGEAPSKLLKINLAPIQLGHVEINDPVFSFVDAGADSTWIGSIYMGSKKAIYRINTRDQITQAYFFTKEGLGGFKHLSMDANGNIWGSTNKGLVFYNPLDNYHELFPLYDNELAIGNLLELNATAVISPDSILVATNNGLFLFDRVQKTFEKIDFNPKDLQEREGIYVETVFIDSRNNYWIGFANHGLQLLNHDLKTFRDYRFLYNVQDGPYDIKEDNNQNLFVGNWRSGLKMYDSKRDTFLQIIDQNGLLKDESEVASISFASDSTLWIITNLGLVDYNLSNRASSLIDIKELDEYEITSSGFFTSKSNGFSYIGTSYGFIKYKPEDLKITTGSTATPSVMKVFSSEENITDLFKKDEPAVKLHHAQNDLSFTLSYIDFQSGVREKQLEYTLEGYEQRWRKGSNEEEVFYYKLVAGSYSFVVRKLGGDGQWKEDRVEFKILPPWWQTWWACTMYLIGIILGGWFIHKTQKERTIRIEREKIRERELSQAKEIEKAYTELKATQTQLIHSEKMASLGELTAGIAHEIQNPLNFVKNFSEVNKELLEELLEEIESANYDDVKELANDIITNEEKIIHHGKRADSIVKGMLMHSRTSTNEKVSTDINALCDEYLRLAYHGLRAKESTFNADFKTDFDYQLENVMIVPQELSRVILNLITNAFQSISGESGLVKVKTKEEGNQIIISIDDNGSGIPDEIIDKIFEPFFTTKPTGQGTGLGLSLSYDIVKAHGGELTVESEVGKGSVFSIILPKN